MILLEFMEKIEIEEGLNKVGNYIFIFFVLICIFFGDSIKEVIGDWYLFLFLSLIAVQFLLVKRDNRVVFSITKKGDDLVIYRKGKENRIIKESNISEIDIHRNMLGKQVILIKEGTYQLVYKYVLGRKARSTVNRIKTKEFKLGSGV